MKDFQKYLRNNPIVIINYMERYCLKDTYSDIKAAGPSHIWDNYANEYVYYEKISMDHLDCWMGHIICRRLNRDQRVYDNLIRDYVQDLALICPNCKTNNYHFNGMFWCCAFC